jgi:hypothetical protein
MEARTKNTKQYEKSYKKAAYKAFPIKKSTKASNEIVLEKDEKLLYCTCTIVLKNNVKDKIEYKTSSIYLKTFSSDVNGLNEQDFQAFKQEIKSLYESYKYNVKTIHDPHRIQEINQKAQIDNIKNKQLTISYRILNELNQIYEQKYPDNFCMIRFILDACVGKIYLTAEILKQQFKEIDIDYKSGISVFELQKWIEYYYPTRISMFVLDPFLKIFKSHVATTHNSNRVTLMFVVNNAHVYPVHESNMQKSISKAKE